MGIRSRRRRGTGGEPPPTFEAIFREHLVYILRYLACLGVQAPDRQDVAQEVFLGAYRALGTFDPRYGAVRAWLTAIAFRQASHYLNRAYQRREQPYPSDAFDGLPYAAPDPETRLIDEDRLQHLIPLLLEIPADRRAILIDHDLHEVSMREIAAHLSIPLNTAWNRLRLAREDLQAAADRWHAAQRRRGIAVLPLDLHWLFRGVQARASRVADDLGRWLESVWAACQPGLPVARALARRGANVLMGALAGGAVIAGAGGRPDPTRRMFADAAAPSGISSQRRDPAGSPVEAALLPTGLLPAPRGDTTDPDAPGADGLPPRRWSPPHRVSPWMAERRLLDRAMVALLAGHYDEAGESLRRHALDFPAGRYVADREALLRKIRDQRHEIDDPMTDETPARRTTGR